jgi:FkbM family methyltransferase
VKLLYKFGKSFEISDFLKQVIEKDSVIFDVGANLGQYAIRLTKFIGENGKVISVEPEFENYRFLLRLKKKYKLKNLVCCNYAVSDYEGTGTLYIPLIDNDIELDTRATIDKDNYYFEYEKYNTRQVNVITLNKLFKELNLYKVDIIKSDTEGNDSKVILGSIDLIKRFLPEILVEDSHNEEWVKALYNIGYQPYYVINNLFLKDAFKIKENDLNVKYDLLVLIHSSKMEKYNKYIIE